jgi:hypothetical protein
MIGSDYCYVHRNLTPDAFKERWFKKYILGRDVPYYTLFSCCKKDKLLSDLESGTVILTKEDILKIPAHEAYVDIYILLLEHNFVSSGDHPKLERAGLWLYQSILHHFPLEVREGEQPPAFHKPIKLLKEKIENYLIHYSGDTLYRFFLFVGMATVGRRKLQRQMQAYIPTLLDTHAAKELSWYSFHQLDEIRKEWIACQKEHPLLSCLTERWLLDIKELYKTEKQIQKIKMNHCKEELMMITWHPDRVSKLLEAGIDFCDM